MKIKVYLLLSLFIFTGCRNEMNKVDVSDAMNKVIKEHPELPKTDNEHYKLERSVVNGEYNYEIQLYTEKISAQNDPQKIMVFINSKKECVAIPFFSNTYRDYWEFMFEENPKIGKKANTTFNKEFLKAMNALNINDERFGRYPVMNDILTSVLVSTKFTKENSEFIKTFLSSNNIHSLEEENSLASERILKNYNEILKTNNFGEPFAEGRVVGYLDNKNFRIYQIVVDTTNQKRLVINLKSYRHDLIKHFPLPM